MNKSTLWPFMASITLSIAGSGLMTSWLLLTRQSNRFIV